MALTVGDIVTRPGTETPYRIAAIRQGRALILPLTGSGARVVPLNRLAQVAADPITT
ncbi:hypothetical protein [Nocardia sp. CC227C]|uniref:hypothetical protein n=1 Tax=Nocardia sp. CC227C TaxID=3044562 RepID=UPI00278BF49F|nr:hypothetical protein [Nocardia sp. CC227C]